MSGMNDDLLVKFLLNETTEEENLMVEQWAADSSVNKKHLEHLELIWITSKNLASQSNIHEDEAWKRFKNRVDQNNPADNSIMPLWHNPMLRNMAATVILIACGWFFYTKILTPEKMLIAGNEVIFETLPDGSEITLNKHTSLSYSFPITAKQRLVRLDKGEVFFHVSPDKTKPFIIKAHGVTVEVVGTSFNVNHLETTTEIIVETGIVRVSEGKATVVLHKGQKVSTGKGNLIPEPVTDELYNYYRTKRFTANNTPLYRIVEVLNKAYGVNIVIENPSNRNLTLTTTFEDESLNQNLKIIAETLNLKIERTRNSIVLK